MRRAQNRICPLRMKNYTLRMKSALHGDSRASDGR